MPPRIRTSLGTPGLLILSVLVVWLCPAPPVSGQIRAVAPAKQPTSSLRELARRLEESIDAGDVYPSPSGWHQLRRSPGLVVVPTTVANDDLERNWTGPSRPWAGYRLKAKPARHLAILEAPSPERQRYRAQPESFRQTLGKVRATRLGRTVNPVFIDSKSGRYLLATDRLVVGLKPEVDAKRYFGKLWKQVRPVWGTQDQYLLTLTGANADQVLAEVRRRSRDPAVAWVEPDFIQEAVKSATPNDPYFQTKQWTLRNTGQGAGTPGADAKLSAAWDLTTGRPGVVIAILDDGVQISHPDLAPNLFLNTGEIPGNGIDDDHNGLVDDIHGYDFFSGAPDPSPVDPEDSHGTSVTGVAAAAGNNGLGVAGAAYGCQFLGLKIIEGDFLVSGSTLAAALRYAAGINRNGASSWRGADVFNISLLFTPSFVVNQALSDAATRGRKGLGCAIFAAAGNSASAWQPYELLIQQAGTYTLRWEYSKDGTGSDGDDTVWLDGVTFPDGTTESFQSGLPAGWTTSASAPWTYVRDGVDGNRALIGWNGTGARSLRAGAIGPNQTTYLEVTKTLPPGTLRFWAWVSSEYNFDLFRFRADGQVIFRDSGVPLTETLVAYPASHPACFAVGASTDFDYRSDYSQYGIGLDFLAPSDGGASTVTSTDRTGGDGYNGDVTAAGDYTPDFGGTSAASPLAAGIAALVWSVNPYLTSGDMRALLRGTCDRIGGVTYDVTGRNSFYGSGRVNASRALNQAWADLRVEISTSTSFANFGDVSTYTVTVQNLGPSRSGMITLTNQLPDAAVFGFATPTPINRSGSRLVFSLASLAPGATSSIKVAVTNLLVGTNLFRAGVSQDVIETVLTNNTALNALPVLPVPRISILDGAVLEGNKGTTNLLLNVLLSNPSAGTVTVGYATFTNLARAGVDYVSSRGTLSFLPGQTNRSLSIRVVGDTRNEADENFFVVLTNAVRAIIERGTAEAIILNDDPLPQLSINNVAVTEGNRGVRKATFKVALSAPSGREVSVDFATASGSAIGGIDFLNTNGTLHFLPGKTSQKIVVPVVGDRLLESNLTFAVTLLNPTNAVVAASQGLGTIINNDKPPKLFIDDLTVTEGDSGETNALFQLRLSAASGLPVSASFVTTNGSATGGVDFLATNGVVVFGPGETNLTLAIPVFGDVLPESDEVFFVKLSQLTNAVAGDLMATATIQNDDPALALAGLASPAPLLPGAPVLEFLGADWVGTGFRLRFRALAGERYRVERCDQLGKSSWPAVEGAEMILGADAIVEVIDSTAKASTSRFYRIRRL